MKALIVLPLLWSVAAAGAVKPAASSTLTTCTKAGLRLTTDQNGVVRFVQYGENIPDNTLRVRQSYDRLGRLIGISVAWSGFAGQMLSARAAYDSRGQLIKETGYRRPGYTTPLKSYLKSLPAGLRCP